MNIRYQATISGIADEIIKEVLQAKTPFETRTIVFHNRKVAQWFKAYYLKQHAEVLMNVQFETLSSFVNGLLKTERQMEIMEERQLRDYLIKALLEGNYYHGGDAADPLHYIYYPDGSVNGLNLYEFAEKLASLFMNYEYDCETIDGWEQELYTRAVDLAKKDNLYTTRSLFEAVRTTDAFCHPTLSGPVYVLDNAYVTQLYQQIMDACEGADITLYTLQESKAPTQCDAVISAPSILREIEAVHSSICRIIREKESVRFNDFVVYAPNISDYASNIRQVFDQNDTAFPHIPFRIVGADNDAEEMKQSLQILQKIASHRFFTRKDLMAFVKNSMVKRVRDISEKEIRTWQQVLEDTNTYRNGKKTNDWEYLKKRLLLSLLVSDTADMDSITGIGQENYLPFSSMDLDTKSLNKLIDIIDGLLAWCDAFPEDTGNMALDAQAIAEMSELLDHLYSIPGTDGEEKNYLYRKVAEENEILLHMNMTIPADTWLRLLLDAPDHFSTFPEDIFLSSVTFLSLTADNVADAPYIYVLGQSSNVFPRVEIRSELDISRHHLTTDKLDAMAIENLCRSSGSRTFSYIRKDLKKDTTLYPSILMPALKSGNPEIIGLDETRNYEELYTIREFTDKQHYESLTGTGQDTELPPVTGEQNRDTQTTVSRMAKYLKSPFIQKYNHILQKEDSTGDNAEFEPIDEKHLRRDNIIRNVILAGHHSKEETELNHLLPEGDLGNIYLGQYEDIGRMLREYLSSAGYVLKELPDLELKDKDTVWTVSCHDNMFIKEQGSELFYVEPKELKDETKLLKTYVFSLIDLVQRNTQEECHVTLGYGDVTKEYRADSRLAAKKLLEICGGMTDYAHMQYMDISILEKYINQKDEEPFTTKKLDSFINEHSDWRYFEDRQMFDRKALFSGNDIEKIMEDECKKMKSMILYYDQEVTNHEQL